MNPGTILAGKYRLLSLLGRGGMGSVWRAEHLALSAPVAVKLISGDFQALPAALTRFEREAKAAASLRSIHVVQTFDHGNPWGNNEPTSEHAHYLYASPGPIAVGGKPAGASVFGHQDLMGNVAEWVRDDYDDAWYSGDGNACVDCANLEAGFPLTRGGSFASLAPAMCSIDCMTPTSRGWGAALRSSIGIRCARDGDE